MTTRMAVSAIQEPVECPACHSPRAFGPRQVLGQYWFAQCRMCPHYCYQPLPKITKKIIYLDQFVLSNILAAKDARWDGVHQRLRVLLSLQMVVCPCSNVHEDESLLAESSRDALKDLYRDLSGEIEFLSPHDIEERQLLNAIGRHLRAEPDDTPWQKPRPWQEFCKSDPHQWTSAVGIYADFPFDPAQVQRLKADNGRLHEGLAAVAADWKDETLSFNDDVQREARGYGKALIEIYRNAAGARQRIEAILPPEMLAAFQDAMGSDAFDPHTPPTMQPGVKLVHRLGAKVHKARPSERDPIAVVEQFFESRHATKAPFQYIASRLRATIAQLVRNPKGPRTAKKSDSYDVTALAHYAPYCDAMVVDNEFCAMASQGNIDVPGRFGVLLFSARTLSAFVAYLDDLLANMPQEHRDALKLIQPQGASVR